MFRSSPTKNDALLQKHVKQEFGKELMLTLDCKTRWNSLLLMIERFYLLKSCVQKALIDANIEISFTKEEFETIAEIITVLTPIKITVESICCEDCDLFKADIALQFMMDELEKSKSPLSKDFQTTLPKRIVERRFIYVDLFHFLHIGEFRDSSNNTFRVCNKISKQTMISQLVTLLRRLHNERGFSEDEDEPEVEIDNTNKHLETLSVGELRENQSLSLKNKLHQKILDSLPDAKKFKRSSEQKTKNELQRTIRAEIKYYEDEGIKGKYLTIAYNYIKTVRPTSVDAERAFSTAGFITTKVWSMLSDESIDNLCFLRGFFNTQKKMFVISNPKYLKLKSLIL